MLEIISAKLTGNPTLPGWSQAYDFKPDDPEKLKKRGQIFVVISTSKEAQGLDKVAAGREILTRLHEEYYGNLEGTPFNVIKSSIEKMIKEFSPVWGDIEIAAISLIDNVIYSAAGGGAEVAILRKGMFAKILQSKKDDVVNASGYPEEGDFLILGSRKFFEGLSEGMVKEALKSGNLSEASDSFHSYIFSKDTGDIGLTLLKFSKEGGVFVKESIEEKPRKDFLQKVKNFPETFSKRVSDLNFSLTKKLPQRKIYIKEDLEGLPEKKKTTLSVGAILLFLLVVSIGFGIRQKTINDRKNLYIGTLREATEKYQESVSLFALEPERAREIFRDAYDLVNKLKNEGIKDNDLEKLIEEMDLKRGEILGEFKKDPVLFIDLSLLTSGFSGDSLSYSLGKLFVLDKNSKKVASILLDTKRTNIIAGPDAVGKVSQMAAYEENVYLLEEDGIFLAKDKKEKMIEKDWQGEVFIQAYAGNIYLLEKSENMIWRFVGKDEDFSDKQRWLAPGIETDFSLVKEILIDGSIWILTSSGKILKFTLGSPQNFNFSDEYPSLTSLDDFYTNEELKNVYVMDKTLERVVVYDKNANYLSQYYSDAISEARDFIVSEKEAKIILLTGDKIYSLDL